MTGRERRLRRALVAAKRAHMRAGLGTGPKAEQARQAVEDAARRCREAGVDISDLVAPTVGQLRT